MDISVFCLLSVFSSPHSFVLTPFFICEYLTGSSSLLLPLPFPRLCPISYLIALLSLSIYVFFSPRFPTAHIYILLTMMLPVIFFIILSPSPSLSSPSLSSPSLSLLSSLSLSLSLSPSLSLSHSLIFKFIHRLSMLTPRSGTASTCQPRPEQRDSRHMRGDHRGPRLTMEMARHGKGITQAVSNGPISYMISQ